jgi:hypothetical protein
MTELFERYRRRPIRFLELWEEPGWQIKVYCITQAGGSLRPELLAAAKGPKIEVPLAEIRRKGLIPALREHARRR